MALGLMLGDTVTVCIGVGAVVNVWGEEEVERTFAEPPGRAIARGNAR